MGTPTEFYEPGYDPTLDRRPPRKMSCLPFFILGFIVLLIAFGVVMYLNIKVSEDQQRIAQANLAPDDSAALVSLESGALTATGAYWKQQTPTATASPTLDDWSKMGTEIFFSTSTATATPSPNPEYCWFLTPTAVIEPTIFVTLDQVQLVATSYALETGTPTPAPTATQPPPRAWCDDPAAAQTEEMPTFPPLSDLIGTAEPPATWTATPPRQQAAQQPQAAPVQQEPQPTQTPAIVYVEREAPTRIIEIQVQVTSVMVITATLGPTNTPTPTQTATHTATSTPTQTATFTPTWTHTATATETPTFTPTWTHTATATETPTFTPTWTYTPTATETPTMTPTPTATETEISS